MKNGEIVAAFQNLNEIIQKKEKYPVKFSYALTRNAKKLEDFMKSFEEERDRLLDQYNIKDRDGNPDYKTSKKINIAEAYEEAWKKEMGELLEIEVEFEPHKIELSDFPDSIEPAVLIALEFMIKE